MCSVPNLVVMETGWTFPNKTENVISKKCTEDGDIFEVSLNWHFLLLHVTPPTPVLSLKRTVMLSYNYMYVCLFLVSNGVLKKEGSYCANKCG